MHDTAHETGRLFFQQYIGDKKCRVLDLGSLDVTGSLRDFATPNIEFIGADMGPGKSVDIVLEDPHKLPFEDGSFDFVVSSSCFEHDNFFWITFLEICRVTKPGGAIYISAPANGVYHTYPVDCWRFYPDSGQALQQWASQNEVKLTLVESFMTNRKNDIWNDCVMIFKREELTTYSGPFISDLYPTVYNVRKFPHSQVVNFEYHSEDMTIEQGLRNELAALQSSYHRSQQEVSTSQAAFKSLSEAHALNLREVSRRLNQVYHQIHARVKRPSELQEFIFKNLPEGTRESLKRKKLEDDIAYLKNSPFFDPLWYLGKNPDVQEAGLDAATHFVMNGELEGRKPNESYEVEHHLARAISYRKLAFAGSYYVEYLKSLQKNPGYIDTFESEKKLADFQPADPGVGREEIFEGSLPKKHQGPDKIDVLFIGHDASMSGAPIALFELIQELTQNYPINARIVLQHGGLLLDKYKKLGPLVVLADLTKRVDSVETATGLISGYFSQIHGDKVVVACTAAVNGEFYKHFSRQRVPVIAWIHEMPPSIENHFGGQKYMQLVSQASKSVVFVSPFSLEQCVSRFGLSKANAKLIPSGIRLQADDRDRREIRDEIRKELNLPLEARIVLGCGTIEHRKGPDLFLQAAKSFLKSAQPGDPEVYFVWIGRVHSPEYRQDLVLDAERAGIGDRILFANERSNSHPYFKASDVFLFTSRSESFGLVAAEAIAYGVPVVGFEDASGASEFITKGHGSLVPYLDIPAMAKELRAYLLKDKSIQDDGNQLISQELSISRFADAFYEEFKLAVGAKKPRSSKSVLVISGGCPPLCGHRVEGGGLRAWGLARSIKRLLPDHEVTLVYAYKLEDKIERGYYDDVFVTEWSPGNLQDLVNNFSTIVMSYCMGDTSRNVAGWLKPAQQLVLDCYVPIYVEICARKSEFIQQEYENLMRDIPYFNDTLKRGDFFLCANQPQYDFYRGVLSALGRINPKTYHDTGLRIVPYGIDSSEPTPQKQPIRKLLGDRYEKSWKILWFGAVYPWFNIKILIDAIQFLHERHPTQMVMVGAKNPFVNHPDFLEKTRQVEALVSAPGVKEIIQTHDWVPFDERADWYLDCDLIITLNEPGMENGLSWRTRVADYVWAGMPIASNGGDPLTEDLIAQGAAGRLDISTPESLSESIYKILADESGLKKMKTQMRAYRPNLYWGNVIKPLGQVIQNHNLAADRT